MRLSVRDLTRGTNRNSFLIILCSVLLFSFAKNLQADEPKFCAPDEPFAPDGVILRMGEGFFRTCRPWTQSSFRQFLLHVNEDAIPGLELSRSSKSLRVMENIKGIDPLKSRLKRLPNVGTRVFGGAKYRSHESAQIGSNGQSNRGTYVYDADDGSDIPDHWITCIGWGRENGPVNCAVYVDVGPVVGSLYFIGIFDKELSYTEHFTEYAKDIALILEVADVTEDLEEFRDFVDIID